MMFYVDQLVSQALELAPEFRQTPEDTIALGRRVLERSGVLRTHFRDVFESLGVAKSDDELARIEQDILDSPALALALFHDVPGVTRTTFCEVMRKYGIGMLADSCEWGWLN